MPSKPKNDYDILEIETLENEGLSERAIEQYKGWSPSSWHKWIKRQLKKGIYSKTVDYIKQPNGEYKRVVKYILLE